MNTDRSIQERVDEAKRRAFLRRMAEVSEGDSERWVPVGILADDLDLSYEQALAIADDLRERGFVRRGGGGRLDPPHGPRIHVLPAGMEFLERSSGAP